MKSRTASHSKSAWALYSAMSERLGQGVAVEVGEQGRGRFVVRNMVAAIDIAVAGAVLKPDPPLPAGVPGGAAGIRRQRLDPGAGNGERSVAGEVAGPVLVAAAERLLDQKAAEAAAIDEQIPFDALAILHHQRLDEAGLAVDRDRADLPFGAADVVGFGDPAQEARVEA